MAEAYIYDHVRTPRGRGKKDGSLHEVPAVRLGAKVLESCATATVSTRQRSMTLFSAASIRSAKLVRSSTFVGF